MFLTSLQDFDFGDGPYLPRIASYLSPRNRDSLRLAKQVEPKVKRINSFCQSNKTYTIKQNLISTQLVFASFSPSKKRAKRFKGFVLKLNCDALSEVSLQHALQYNFIRNNLGKYVHNEHLNIYI